MSNNNKNNKDDNNDLKLKRKKIIDVYFESQGADVYQKLTFYVLQHFLLLHIDKYPDREGYTVMRQKLVILSISFSSNIDSINHLIAAVEKIEVSFLY